MNFILKGIVILLFFQISIAYSQAKIIDAKNYGFSVKNNSIANTSALNKAIKSLKNGGVVKISVPGVYYVDGTNKLTKTNDYLRDEGGIEMLDNTTLLMEKGVILKQIPTSLKQYNVVRIFNKKNVRIEGGEILGDRESHTGSDGEWGYGIAISGGENISIKNLKVSNLWGDGINIQHVVVNNKVKVTIGIVIDNVTAFNNRRQGMSIEGGKNIKVFNSKFNKTNGVAPQSGVDIEPWHPNSIVEDVLFRNCFFEDNAHAGLIAGGQAKINNIRVEQCFFRNNKINESNGGQCTFYKDNTNIQIIKNIFEKGDEGSSYGLSIFDSSFSNVENNNFTDCSFNLAGIGISNNIKFSYNTVTFKKNIKKELLFMNFDRSISNFNNIVFQNNIFNFQNAPDLIYKFYFIINSGSILNNQIIHSYKKNVTVFNKQKKEKVVLKNKF